MRQWRAGPHPCSEAEAWYYLSMIDIRQTKITINGALLTYIAWFLGTLPAVVLAGPYGIDLVGLLQSTVADPKGHTAETFLATILVTSSGLAIASAIHQLIVVILCPLFAYLLLRDYPLRRTRAAALLFVLLCIAPAWLLIAYFTDLYLLSLSLVVLWTVLSPYAAWRWSTRQNSVT